MSCARLGDVAVAARQLDDARAWFERELAAIEALAGAEVGNAALQHDLAAARARRGRVELAAGRFLEARAWFDAEHAAVIFDRIRGASALAGDPELAAFGALVAR